jgi:hypothetical protein
MQKNIGNSSYVYSMALFSAVIVVSLDKKQSVKSPSGNSSSTTDWRNRRVIIAADRNGRLCSVNRNSVGGGSESAFSEQRDAAKKRERERERKRERLTDGAPKKRQQLLFHNAII